MVTNIRKTTSADFGNLHVDQLVTNQAMEFWQDDARFLAIKDVPMIPVDQPSGILSVLDRDDLNRDEVQQRGRGAEAEKGSFSYKDLTYKTDERSIEYDANAADVAGASPGRDPSLVIPRALAYKGNLHVEGRFASSIFAGSKWYRVVTGAGANGSDSGTAMNRVYWSTASSDPIADIRKEIDIFLQRTGMLPTNLRFGRQLFTSVATNPNVRAQVAVTVAGVSQTASFVPPATTQQLSTLLGLKVSVGSAIKNTAAKNIAASNSFIVPAQSALLTFDTPNMVTNGKEPTAFARIAFTKLAANGFQVRSFPRPEIGPGGSMASVLDLYQGFLITDNLLGTYFDTMGQ